MLEVLVQFAQPLLGRPARGDVDRRPDHADAAALVVEDSPALRRHPPLDPILLADRAVFDVVEGAGRRIGGRRIFGADEIAIGGVKAGVEVVHRHRNVRRDAEHGLHPRRPVKSAGRAVDVPETHVGGLGRETQLFLAVLQRGFGLQAIDQVRRLPREHVEVAKLAVGRPMRRPPVGRHHAEQPAGPRAQGGRLGRSNAAAPVDGERFRSGHDIGGFDILDNRPLLRPQRLAGDAAEIAAHDRPAPRQIGGKVSEGAGSQLLPLRIEVLDGGGVGFHQRHRRIEHVVVERLRLLLPDKARADRLERAGVGELLRQPPLAVAQGLFDRLAFGDVDRRPRHPDRPSRRAGENDLSGDREPANGGVRQDDANVRPKFAGTLRIAGPPDSAGVAIPIVGMQQLRQRGAQRQSSVRGQTEEREHPFIRLGNVVFDMPDEGPHPGRGDRLAQAFIVHPLRDPGANRLGAILRDDDCVCVQRRSKFRRLAPAHRAPERTIARTRRADRRAFRSMARRIPAL